MTSRRAIVVAILLGMAVLPSCGVCMLVQNSDAELRTPDGIVTPVRVSYRTPGGILNYDGRWYLGILMEPVDWVVSVVTACSAPFDDEIDLAWGPAGFLLTLTPFATYFPSPDGRLRSRTADVDAATRDQILAGDVDAACTAFGDGRIRAVRTR